MERTGHAASCTEAKKKNMAWATLLASRRSQSSRITTLVPSRLFGLTSPDSDLAPDGPNNLAIADLNWYGARLSWSHWSGFCVALWNFPRFTLHLHWSLHCSSSHFSVSTSLLLIIAKREWRDRSYILLMFILNILEYKNALLKWRNLHLPQWSQLMYMTLPYGMNCV